MREPSPRVRFLVAERRSSRDSERARRHRRIVLVAAVGGVLLATLVPRVGAGELQARPNIILLLCDDLGWGDTAYNGNLQVRTPHLDAMSREGLRFDRFYAAAPVCSPTRGSCLTGRHPYRYGITFANRGFMKREELCLGEILGARGYATGHFGKWHLGTLTTTIRDANRGRPGKTSIYSPPWENGFDVCFSTESKVPTWDPMKRPRDLTNKNTWEALAAGAPHEPYGTFYWEGPDRRAGTNLDGDDSRIIMDRVVPFIEQAVREARPFLAVVWFHAPHLPVVAGPRHAALYAELPLYERNYFGCITAMDEQVGRLRRQLTRLGIERETMIWFASDNGPEGKAGAAPGSAGPFRGRKRDLYEGGIRVPGILVWPARVPEHRQVDAACTTSDYLPTIMAILGDRLPSRPIDGVDLTALIDGKRWRRPRPLGFQSGKVQALIDGRYKLLRFLGKGRMELYDLIADPGESDDLASRQPEVVARMSATLERWVASCRASAEGRDYEGD